MGAVYKAFDPDIKRPVAIKTVRWDLLQTGGPAGAIGARFRNEAQAAGRLTHPGIVAVYEYGQSADCAFIAMEYVEGCDLREYFTRGKAFALADVVSIMVQLLEALEHAHQRKVWHRDIKPANLIVMNNGSLKVADFGIARIDAPDVTQTFPLMGTPGYSPPEMYRGQSGDHRADIFAAGAVMYQLLTGRRPFDGGFETVIDQVCNKDPAPLTANDGVSACEHFDAVVRRAMAKDPKQRFDTASAFRDAILAAHAQPICATVSLGVIIAQSERGRGPADASVRPVRKSGSTSERIAWPHGWDPATLGSVEGQLAQLVGPMARVLVLRAARRCSDFDTLVHMLAVDLDSFDERSAFLSGLEMAPTKPKRAQETPFSVPGSADPAAGVARSRLDLPAVDLAAQVLANLIGPLARVIIKRASDQSSDMEEFYRLVAEGIPSQTDRAAFLRSIRAPR